MNNEMEIIISGGDYLPTPVGFFKHGDDFTNSLSPETQRAYLYDIKEFFEVSDLSDINIAMIKNVSAGTARMYTDKLVAKGRAKSTINRKLTALSSFYRFLCRREIGIMDFNPFDTGEGATRMSSAKRYSNTRCLTKDEVQRVVRVTMEGSDLEAIRNRILVLLLATTGVRRGELSSFTIGMIKRTHGENVIEFEGKGKKERMIKINNTIKTFIDKYIEMRGLTYKSDGNKPLFVSHTTNAKHFGEDKAITSQTIYNVIKKIADKAGIDAQDVSPHCFRHTFVTEALGLGIKLEDVADMAGHADLSTTRRYDHTKRVLKNNPADKLTEMFLGE